MRFESPQPERVHDPEAESAYWERVHAEFKDEYESLWRPEQRKAYLEQGAEFLAEARHLAPDTMVFLDRSARPLAGFFRALWRRAWPDAEPPAMKFLTGFRHGKPHVGAKVEEAFEAGRQDFEGKSVLFVDDSSGGGKQLQAAEEGLRAAFPTMGEAYLGAMWVDEGALARDIVDIDPPEGSTYTQALETSDRLGQAMYGRMAKRLDKEPGVVRAEVRKDRSAADTFSTRLLELGRTEHLDQKSIDGMGARIEAATDDKERGHLMRVRDLYQKLSA